MVRLTPRSSLTPAARSSANTGTWPAPLPRAHHRRQPRPPPLDL